MQTSRRTVANVFMCSMYVGDRQIRWEVIATASTVGGRAHQTNMSVFVCRCTLTKHRYGSHRARLVAAAMLKGFSNAQSVYTVGHLVKRRVV